MLITVHGGSTGLYILTKQRIVTLLRPSLCKQENLNVIIKTSLLQ
jgi:hypothetical protein